MKVPQYYLNITYLERYALIRCVMPNNTKYSGVPDFRVSGSKLEEITDDILSIGENLPEEQINLNLMSLKHGQKETIMSNKELKKLCDKLNKKQSKIKFKLAA